MLRNGVRRITWNSHNRKSQFIRRAQVDLIESGAPQSNEADPVFGERQQHLRAEHIIDETTHSLKIERQLHRFDGQPRLKKSQLVPAGIGRRKKLTVVRLGAEYSGIHLNPSLFVLLQSAILTSDAAMSIVHEPILGVVFDLDGTLVDSQLDFEAMRRQMNLSKGAPLLETIASLPPEQASKCWQILEQHERRGAEIAVPIPGAHELLQTLRRLQVHIGVLTRNGCQFARITLDRLDLPHDALVTRDDASPKPNPAGLLQFLSDWSIAPTRAAIIGDYRFDLEAGRAAGMRTVLYAADCTAEEWAAWRHLADHRVNSFLDPRPLLAWLGLDAQPAALE
jgi:HAD superfamily hydrolase (TIGR01509 family)